MKSVSSGSLNPAKEYLLAVSLILVCGMTHAADGQRPALDLGITLGTAWSDNIALSPIDERSGGIGFVGLTLARQNETARLRSSFDVNLGYQRYLDNEFDSDVVGGATGTVVVGIVPRVFSWVLQDNFTQVRNNALAADTPDNWVTANYFTTGPELRLPLGTANSLIVTGRYSVDSYGSEAADGRRVGGTLGLVHQFSNLSSASANLEIERRKFKNAPAGISYDPEYTASSAFLNYSLEGERTSVDADIGYTQVDLVSRTAGSLLGRLEIARRLTQSSSLTLNLKHDYSDTGNSFRSGQESDGVDLNTDLTQLTSDAFVTDSVRLGWQLTLSRTQVNAAVEYAEDNYERESDLDRNLTRYSLAVQRQVRPTTSVGAEFYGVIEDLSAFDAKSNETGARLSLDWAMAPTLGWELLYAFRSRGGDGLVERFTENRATLSIEWSPFSRR